MIANVWRGTAFSMILLYAGLLVIPRSLYEAAAVDGATALRQFRYITLPQLRPILLINTILIRIFTLNTFDLILPLTGGGPGRATEVLALYAYNTVFRNFDLSNGAVLAVILLLISLVFTFFYVRLLPKEELSGVRQSAAPASPTSAPTSPMRVICLFFAGPLLWLVSLSIRTAAEIYVSDIRLWPDEPDARELRAPRSATRCSRPTSGTA